MKLLNKANRDKKILKLKETKNFFDKQVAENPENIISILEEFLTEERKKKIDNIINNRIGSFHLVLDRPHDPHNCSAALRSAEAFGIQYVHIINSEEDFFVSKKVTSGSYKWLTTSLYKDYENCIDKLKDNNFMLIGADRAGYHIKEIPLKTPLALIIGSEHDGILPQIKDKCDYLVSIEMFGFVESFNLSVATSLLLGETVKFLPRGNLSEEEKLILKAKWYIKSIPHGEDILEAKLR